MRRLALSAAAPPAVVRTLIVAAAAIAVGVLAAPASAGTFRVSQCNATDDSGPRPAAVQAALWSTAGGWMLSDCGFGGPGLRAFTPNLRLPVRGTTTTTFSLPRSMPHASLRAVSLDYHSLPEAPSVAPAVFTIRAGGAILLYEYAGVGTTPGSAERFVVPAGSRSLAMATWCSPAFGPGWCSWSGPLLQVRALTAEVEESAEPAALAAGPLLAPGPHAGVEPLTLSAADADSGVHHVRLTLGGVTVADIAGDCAADRLPSCPQQLHRTIEVDTRRVRDGMARLALTVTDAAGNQRFDDIGTVRVLNHPPRPRPPRPAPAPVPAPLPPPVAAPAPAGPPPHPVTVPGHMPNGHPASTRARVRAWFEWGGRRRRSVTVPAGVRVRIRGRVTDPHGRGIAGAALGLIERWYGVPRWATGVRTRADGRFTAFTRLGPPRTLRFVYYPYADSSRPRRGPLLRLRVGPPPGPHRGRPAPAARSS